MLRRALSRRVSVAGMLEFGLWCAIPYLVIGFAWAFVDVEQVGLIDSALRARVPAGSDVAAFVLTAASWPARLFGVELCAG